MDNEELLYGIIQDDIAEMIDYAVKNNYSLKKLVDELKEYFELDKRS